MKKRAVRKSIGVCVFILLVFLISLSFSRNITGSVVDEGENYGNQDFVLSLDEIKINQKSLDVGYNIVELGGKNRELVAKYQIYNNLGVLLSGEEKISVNGKSIGDYSMELDFDRQAAGDALISIEVSEGDRKSKAVRSIVIGAEKHRGGIISGDKSLATIYFLFFVTSLGLLFFITRLSMERSEHIRLGREVHDKHLIKINSN